MRRQDWQREEVRARQRLAERILGRSLSPAPHQWLSVADNPSSVADRARAAGVEVVPASVFAVGRDHVAALRVSLTAARSRRDLARGLERLAKVLL